MNREQIQEVYKELREEMDMSYHRVLPFNELLVDRWEKAAYLKFGKKTSIYDSAIVMGDVFVGKNTWIGPSVLLDGTGNGLYVGDNCNISAGVQIYTHDTVRACVTGDDGLKEVGTVKIGNNCYIGPQSVISRGVTLGDRCVVATNSFVNKSFPSNTIIAGTPAKRIGWVDVRSGDEVLKYDR